MITEDYCSFELSKLLKEKGFHAPDLHGLDSSLGHLWIKVTHQMAMKWLREKNIDIVIMPLFKLKEGRIYCYEIHSDTEDIRTGQFKTYEEAVEAALKYVLENLI